MTGCKLSSLSYLRKSAFICGLFFFVLASGATAYAQGGKAEPNRIEFKRGTTSTTVSGTVRNDEQAEYVVSAQLGQGMVMKLTNVPAKSAGFGRSEEIR